MKTTKKLSLKEIKELCEKNGLTVRTYYRRVKSGWKDPFLPAQKKYVGCRPITVNGVEYPSISKACKALGADYGLVHKRIRSKYKGADIFAPPRPEPFLPLRHAPCKKVPEGYISLKKFGEKYPALRRNVRHSILSTISNRVVIRHFCKFEGRVYVEESFWKEYVSYIEYSGLINKFNIPRGSKKFKEKLKENNFCGRVLRRGFKCYYYFPEFLTEKLNEDYSLERGEDCEDY